MGLSSPAKVVARTLVAHGLGIAPAPPALTDWQTFFSKNPAAPDNVITVFNVPTAKIWKGMRGDDVVIHHGIQVRARNLDSELAYSKARSIQQFLSAAKLLACPAIAGDSTVYKILHFSLMDDLIFFEEQQAGAKSVWFFRGTLTLQES